MEYAVILIVIYIVQHVAYRHKTISKIQYDTIGEFHMDSKAEYSV